MSSYLKLDSTLNTYVNFDNTGFPTVGSGSASFTVWARVADRSISNILFQKYDGSTGYQAKFNEESNGDLSLDFLVAGATSETTTISNVPVKLGEWQLYVFVKDEVTGKLKIYIDAVIHADTNSVSTPSGTIDNSDDFYMGFDSANPSSSLSGKIDIDSLSFYDDILDEADIVYLYNRGRGRKIDGTETDIIFGLNLDEATGAIVNNIVPTVSTGTITSDASPFDNVWGATGGVAVMLPSDIKIYLTSLEPDIQQTNYSQSLGGYIAYSESLPAINSLLYPETILDAALGLYGTSITLDDATDLIGYSYLSILNEIIKVDVISSINVTATERGVNGAIGYYPDGTIVQGVASPFNDSFDTDRRQYRCYAIRNNSTTESAYGISAFFSQISENTNTTMRVAFEIPKSQGITGVSTSWTSSMLIDSSLAGTYADNLFADSYMTFEDSPNAGERIRISSYDGDTGTFVFADSISPDYDPLLHSSSINYTVDASPAQRIKSGTDTPIDTDYITVFSEAANRGNALALSQILSGGNLLFGEIVYIWIEREIGKSSEPYEENSFVLNVDFEKELEEQ